MRILFASAAGSRPRMEVSTVTRSYQLVVRRGVPTRTVRFDMGKGARGLERTLEAVERWLGSSERFSGLAVRFQEVAPWIEVDAQTMNLETELSL